MRSSNPLSCAVSGHVQQGAWLNSMSNQSNQGASEIRSRSPLEQSDGESRTDIRRRAMDLLARREHSRQELRRKLYQRFSDTDVIEQVLEKLIDDQLLSDARFAESYTSMRRKAGFGPVRISAELRERGVSESIIARHVEPNTAQWYRQAALVRAKKFSESTELSTEERAKQSRFLQYRGFTYEHIAQVFNNEETYA